MASRMVAWGSAPPRLATGLQAAEGTLLGSGHLGRPGPGGRGSGFRQRARRRSAVVLNARRAGGSAPPPPTGPAHDGARVQPSRTRHAAANRGRRCGSVFLCHLHEDVARGCRLLARLDEHHPKALRVEQRPVEVVVLLGFHQMNFAGLGDEGADEPFLTL